MGHGEFDRKSPKLEIMRKAMKRLRRLFPGVKLSIYYHSQLIEAKDFTPYAEDRVIGKNGKIAKAIRTVMRAAAVADHRDVNVEIR